MLKKALKIIGLVFILLLASAGIGLTGAAPISISRKGRGDTRNEANIELVEERKDRLGESESEEIG